MKIYSYLLLITLFLAGCRAAQTSSSASLAEGLIAHYPISGDARDVSSNSLGGVLGKHEGSTYPTLVQDRLGRDDEAYRLSGSNYIDLSESPLFNLGNYPEFTISVWVNPSDTTNGIILSKYISAGDNRMWLLRFWEENIRFGAFNRVYKDSNIINAPRLKGWQLLTVVLDEDQYTLYINGKRATGTPKTVKPLESSPTAKTLIGAVHFSNKLFDRLYTGDIDDVRFYRRALTTKEIKRLYRQR